MDRPTLAPAASPAPALRAPAHPWRYHTCRALLGVEHDGELHVKHKEIEHWIRGRCRHVCRRCGAMNTRVVATPSVAAPSGDRR